MPLPLLATSVFAQSGLGQIQAWPELRRHLQAGALSSPLATALLASRLLASTSFGMSTDSLL